MSKHHSTKHTVHLIPSFHHDVEYLKTYEEYIDIGLDNLREMFEIMRRDPDYTFFIEQAILLEELWEREPGYREELKRLVQEGRIELSPGMYSNPDMNIPSGIAHPSGLVREEMDHPASWRRTQSCHHRGLLRPSRPIAPDNEGVRVRLLPLLQGYRQHREEERLLLGGDRRDEDLLSLVGAGVRDDHLY